MLRRALEDPNAFTTVIATCAPAATDAEHTMCTLEAVCRLTGTHKGICETAREVEDTSCDAIKVRGFRRLGVGNGGGVGEGAGGREEHTKNAASANNMSSMYHMAGTHTHTHTHTHLRWAAWWAVRRPRGPTPCCASGCRCSKRANARTSSTCTLRVICFWQGATGSKGILPISQPASPLPRPYPVACHACTFRSEEALRKL